MSVKSPEGNTPEVKPVWKGCVIAGLAACAVTATALFTPAVAAHAEVPQAPAIVQVESGAVNDLLGTVKEVIPGSQAAIEMIAPERATRVADLSGAGSQLDALSGIKGTDLGITFKLNGGYGFIVGDSFDTEHPSQGTAGWQSNAMFHSGNTPDANSPIQLDHAYGGNDAPELINSPHDTSGNGEWSAIPNDAVQLSNGDLVMSYQSVRHWDKDDKQEWVTNYAGLAVSRDGGHTWDRDAGPKWMNDGDNNDPNQMVSMQRDDDGYVYMVSTQAGRQDGEMVMKRVYEDNILDKAAYEDLGVLFTGNIGEPSLRKFDDTWVMTYLDKTRNAIFSRVADSPTGSWSAEKLQVSGDDGVNNLYGGFIHPASTKGNLMLTVSQWDDDDYRIIQYAGTAYGHPLF